MKDLAAGMQLSEGSIYKAFGDERNVFLAALERQDAEYGAALRSALRKVKSGKEKLRAALLFYVALSHGSAGMQGCLVITTAVELASADAEIARRVRDSYCRREVFLANIIRDGQADGSIPKHIDSDGTAWFLLFLFQGLRVVGRTGVTRKELMATDAVMKTFD